MADCPVLAGALTRSVVAVVGPRSVSAISIWSQPVGLCPFLYVQSLLSMQITVQSKGGRVSPSAHLSNVLEGPMVLRDQILDTSCVGQAAQHDQMSHAAFKIPRLSCLVLWVQ